MAYANYKPPTLAKHHVDLGQRFGKLVVTELDLRLEPKNPRRPDGRKRSAERAVRVRCDCGTEKVIKLTNLINSKTQQTQCNQCLTGSNTTSRNSEQYLYHLHRNILARCYNPRNISYPDYGARGIRLAEEWRDYDAFCAGILGEIGERPEGTSIDRIDVEGHYAPGNVRWATTREQAKNKRPRGKRLLISAGQIQEALNRYDAGGITYGDLARDMGIPERALYARVTRLRRSTQ